MKLLQQLIQIPSVSGSETQIQGFIFSYLKNRGLDPKFVGGNVVVKISGKHKNTAIIFNAHVDTVHPGETTLWQYSPFSGKILDKRIYGLGASDEKAAVATLLLLCQKYSEEKPACDVWLTFVTKEEIDGTGTQEVLAWFHQHYQKKYQAVGAILGEPTGLTEFEIAHKGNVFLQIISSGNAGHASNPKLIKKHAVLEMFKVIKKMKKLEKIWRKKYKDPLLGYPTIGVCTSITAGNPTSPNKFPDSCSATFDIRTTPKLHDQVLAEVTKNCLGYTVAYVYPPIGYGYTDPKSPLVSVINKVTGVKPTVSSWSCDLCFFSQYAIPAVVFGPGERGVIHQPNEFCEIQKVQDCVNLYHRCIEAFGGLKS